MKSTVLLAFGLFLISAPAPDASDIAEFTHNFIVPEQLPGLEASEVPDGKISAANSSSPASEMRLAPTAGESSAEKPSATADRSVQLVRERIKSHSGTEG